MIILSSSTSQILLTNCDLYYRYSWYPLLVMSLILIHYLFTNVLVYTPFKRILMCFGHSNAFYCLSAFLCTILSRVCQQGGWLNIASNVGNMCRQSGFYRRGCFIRYNTSRMTEPSAIVMEIPQYTAVSESRVSAVVKTCQNVCVIF